MPFKDTVPNLSLPPRGLFPLDGQAVAACADMFADQSDARLRLIHRSNLMGLSADDPVRYVLQFGARPSIGAVFQREEPVAHAYLTGACIASAMTQIGMDQRYGQDVRPAMFFDPQTAPILEHPRRRHRLPFMGHTDQWLNKLAHTDDVYGLMSYFTSEEVIEHIGTLKAEWLLRNRRNGAGSATGGAASDGVADYLTLGMNDTFAMLAYAYGETPREQPVLHRGFDSRKHIMRPNSRHRRVEDPPGLALGIPRLMAGVRTAADQPGFAYEPGSYARAELPTWQLWQPLVPRGSRLTHVATYMAADILEEPGRTDTVVEVALRDTLREFKLMARDVLLTKGSISGSIRPYVYPFNNNANNLSWHDQPELLALCRQGEVVPLAEFTSLDAAQQDILRNYTERITKSQGMYTDRLLGSIAARPLTWLSGVPAAVALAYARARALVHGYTQPAPVKGVEDLES